MVRGWREDPDARAALTRELAGHPGVAFAWETAPSSAATRDAPFAQEIVEVAALEGVPADPRPFARHLEGDGPIAVFDNLGGDARLIAPRPIDPGADHAHLAAFIRSAPAEQIDALWRAVGEAIAERWAGSEAPLWVSTAGLGVSWLHVRLDSRPKYYRHRPFRAAPY